MESQIDEHGAIQGWKLTNDSGRSAAPDEWLDALSAAAPRFTFMPGYHEGKPVPMRHVEPMTWTF